MLDMEPWVMHLSLCALNEREAGNTVPWGNLPNLYIFSTWRSLFLSYNACFQGPAPHCRKKYLGWKGGIWMEKMKLLFFTVDIVPLPETLFVIVHFSFVKTLPQPHHQRSVCWNWMKFACHSMCNFHLISRYE